MTDATFKRGDRVEYVGVSMKGKRGTVHRILTGWIAVDFDNGPTRSAARPKSLKMEVTIMDLLFTMVLWTVTAPVWLLLGGLMWIILLSPIWMTVWMIDRGRSKRVWARLKAQYEG